MTKYVPIEKKSHWTPVILRRDHALQWQDETDLMAQDLTLKIAMISGGNLDTEDTPPAQIIYFFLM
jgi:hypothetical protein